MRLGVDVIEAGFPASSPGDFESVQRIGAEVGDAVGRVRALARGARATSSWRRSALATAKRPRIHTGIGVSESHLRDKLRIREETALERAVAAVKLARTFVDDVEFYAEDAGRAEPAFLYRDDRGGRGGGRHRRQHPGHDRLHVSRRVRRAHRAGSWSNVAGIEGVTVSVHCHDDLGMATANALAGVAAGARQIECTINGIGERAGNTSLEEVVMALRQRRDLLRRGHAASTRARSRARRGS